jgi:hypothetical protein
MDKHGFVIVNLEIWIKNYLAIIVDDTILGKRRSYGEKTVVCRQGSKKIARGGM